MINSNHTTLCFGVDDIDLFWRVHTFKSVCCDKNYDVRETYLSATSKNPKMLLTVCNCQHKCLSTVKLFWQVVRPKRQKCFMKTKPKTMQMPHLFKQTTEAKAFLDICKSSFLFQWCEASFHRNNLWSSHHMLCSLYFSAKWGDALLQADLHALTSLRLGFWSHGKTDTENGQVKYRLFSQDKALIVLLFLCQRY